MRTLYYLVDLEGSRAIVEILGPYATAAERDAAETHPGQLPMKMKPEPHKDNPNEECLMILTGLEEGLPDLSGPYPDAEQRHEAMRWYTRDGEPYVVALDIRHGKVAHVSQMTREDIDPEGGIFASPSPTTPQEEEETFEEWMTILAKEQQ